MTLVAVVAVAVAVAAAVAAGYIVVAVDDVDSVMIEDTAPGILLSSLSFLHSLCFFVFVSSFLTCTEE